MSDQMSKKQDGFITMIKSSIQFSSVAQLYLTLCDPTDCSPPGSSVHEDSLGKNTGVGFHALLQGSLLDPGFEPEFLASPALAGGFFSLPHHLRSQ